jgi:hypothetical protein
MLPKPQPANEAPGGMLMTEREAQLRALGVGTGTFPLDGLDLEDMASASLSGYGIFTPITVRPYTMPKNAKLERDK